MKGGYRVTNHAGPPWSFFVLARVNKFHVVLGQLNIASMNFFFFSSFFVLNQKFMVPITYGTPYKPASSALKFMVPITFGTPYKPAPALYHLSQALRNFGAQLGYLMWSSWCDQMSEYSKCIKKGVNPIDGPPSQTLTSFFLMYCLRTEEYGRCLEKCNCSLKGSPSMLYQHFIAFLTF